MYRLVTRLVAVFALLALGACTYDFDESVFERESAADDWIWESSVVETANQTPVTPEELEEVTPETVTSDSIADDIDVVDIDIRDGTLVGRIGPVDDLDHPASIRALPWFHPLYDGYALVANTDAGAAMVVIVVRGDLISMVENIAYDGWTDSNISVVGCAGPVEGQWDYDNEADSATVDVEEDEDNPDVLHMTVEASFFDGSVVTASADLHITYQD